MTDRPLLFLGVDGTLLPFAGAGWQVGDDVNPLASDEPVEQISVRVAV